MSAVVALATIAIGLAYIVLGLLSGAEVLLLKRMRGVSRFGVGFTLMAASCGPHHLMHGWQMLHGHDGGGLLAITTVLGLPAGLVFVALRVEAMRGRRGDRFIAGSPWWITAVPFVFVLTSGALVALALRPPPAVLAPAAHSMTGAAHAMPGVDPIVTSGLDPTSLVFLTNVFVTVTYGLVGWFLLRTQVRRRPSAGGWSLSGLALAAVFPTCALMHLVYALTARGSAHTAVFDLLGVPASIYFLWVVYQVYGESIVDWNRRPIVGRPARPSRPSPWESRV